MFLHNSLFAADLSESMRAEDYGRHPKAAAATMANIHTDLQTRIQVTD
jgi:hypothetical protein